MGSNHQCQLDLHTLYKRNGCGGGGFTCTAEASDERFGCLVVTSRLSVALADMMAKIRGFLTSE
jgi:hypothetical protein